MCFCCKEFVLLMTSKQLTFVLFTETAYELCGQNAVPVLPQPDFSEEGAYSEVNTNKAPAPVCPTLILVS